MKALVTGATGLIGSRLLRKLATPRVMARDPGRARRDQGVTDVVAWECSRPFPASALEGVDVIFHMAGSPVASGRMTAARKLDIRRTRVEGTRRVVEALRAAGDSGPRALVSASAVGIYGSRGDETLTEESAKGEGFLADICEEWEREALAATDLGVRVVCARIGLALAREGGALRAMRPAFIAGMGGVLGSGGHWMPWIHVADVVGLLLHAARAPDVTGALNLTAPAPATNRTFTTALARAVHRPAIFRVPVPALRAIVGDLAYVMTASQRVLPQKATDTGYSFQFATLDEALADLERPSEVEHTGGMASS